MPERRRGAAEGRASAGVITRANATTPRARQHDARIPEANKRAHYAVAALALDEEQVTRMGSPSRLHFFRGGRLERRGELASNGSEARVLACSTSGSLQL